MLLPVMILAVAQASASATRDDKPTTVHVQLPQSGAMTTVYSEIPGTREPIFNVLGVSLAQEVSRSWMVEVGGDITKAADGIRPAFALRGGPFVRLYDARGESGFVPAVALTALGHLTLRGRSFNMASGATGQSSLAAGLAPALDLTWSNACIACGPKTKRRTFNIRLRPVVAVALWRSNDSPKWSGHEGYGSYSDGYRVQVGFNLDLGVVF